MYLILIISLVKSFNINTCRIVFVVFELPLKSAFCRNISTFLANPTHQYCSSAVLLAHGFWPQISPWKRHSLAPSPSPCGNPPRTCSWGRGEIRSIWCYPLSWWQSGHWVYPLRPWSVWWVRWYFLPSVAVANPRWTCGLMGPYLRLVHPALSPVWRCM